jgi:parvulin-like peptidyl-prolyl isomerase
MKRHAFRFVISVGLVLCLHVAVGGAQTPDGQPASSQSPPVAAVVNGEPVYVRSLEAKYSEIARQRGHSSQISDETKAKILEHAVKRQLVIQALERDKTLVKPEELDRKRDEVAAQIKKERGVTLEEYAQKYGLAMESMRSEMYWQLAWNRYLDRHLADALEGYFEKHKKELDGTEVRASHILLRPERYNETDEQIVARAKKIRADIESGKITFEEAAAKYSAGPSRDKGGDLGFIPRYGVMLSDFASAAFELKNGEISQPVTTPFGTHLIRVTDVKPGSRQWTEVIPQIKTVAAVDLFDELAAVELMKAKIEYTGNVPYFNPDTKELVVPAGAEQAATK